ncbi:MAG: tol-pal system-associated acyl-CoA thioesterase [Maritimibacter sp.]|nr:tol-pal system-associated acyl-CoA thioesterase [Maritimibacter sp.]
MTQTAPHTHPVRVYYEDTDLAGIVYYANYLRFIERGRTEYVRARGIDQAALREETGIVFAVRRVEADYLAPARFGDDLSVETEVEAIKGASLTMRQRVTRSGQVLFDARVVLVALDGAGRAARLPADIRRLLG